VNTAPSKEDSILHEYSPPGIRWTTVNMAEVLPGVLTPLGWTFWRDPCEAGLRAAFADAGVLPARQVTAPEALDGRLTGLFHGRLAGNLTLVCELCDHMPGSSGAAFEEQMFGRADPDVERHPSVRRYPVVAAKMPVNLVLLPGRLRSLRSEIDTWWRAATGPSPADPPEVRLEQARQLLRRAMRRHMLASLAAQGCYDRVTKLAAAAGHPGLELDLMTGYGGMEETNVSADLWDVSRGDMTMREFLGRHGFHAPNEGQLASRSWREDPRAITEITGSYRRMPDDQSPKLRESAQIDIRRRAETTLLAALPRARRRAAKSTLAVAARYLPMREIGKAAFLQTVDGGRAAAREIGDRLVGEGRLTDREDVFFATLHEISGSPPNDLAQRTAERRRRHADYLDLQLPERWVGTPVPVARAAQEELRRESVVLGVPVSSGIAEGRARVVRDPDEVDDFEPGDILVCETTDPSWVVLFQLAGAVVIDVGGSMSHGAIVARELGLPAVINTRIGTHTIADGDLIRVDGSAGRVEIIAPATRSPHAP
jgi:phosphohistidine swiveling domain-containing protein